MVVNSEMDTKGFSRVATFAKASAAKEHVERVDLWKRVEKEKSLHISEWQYGILFMS